MLDYAVGLFFVALAVAFFGITGIVGGALKVAKILFVGSIFLIVFALVGRSV